MIFLLILKKSHRRRKKMRIKWFDNSMQAWEGLNEAFLRNDEWLNASVQSHCLYSYDTVIGIRDPKVDPEFDFGRHFNYTMNKWRQLVNNYLDLKELKEIKEEINILEFNKKFYALALQFSNNHEHGKNCLLSMVFSKRPRQEKPNIAIFMRASEVTKRLICDLLLFQRIGELVFQGDPFTITIHFNQIFNDDSVLLMYHAHKDVFKIMQAKGIALERQKEITTLLKKLISQDPEKVKYKVHRRAVKVLRPDLVKYPVTLAKDCKL